MTDTVENLKALGYKLVPEDKGWRLYRPTPAGTRSLLGVITGEMPVEEAWEIALAIATDREGVLSCYRIPETLLCNRQDFP